MNGEPICLLLVGSDGALLEGLSQSLGALGYATVATQELRDARDLAAARPPLIAVVEATQADTSLADALGIPLAAGGALVLYNVTGNGQSPVLSPTLQRAVLANITLPLERQRLIALVQHVAERARTTGRRRDTPPERTAP
jgi:DNA-binding NtrC family response regulator